MQLLAVTLTRIVYHVGRNVHYLHTAGAALEGYGLRDKGLNALTACSSSNNPLLVSVPLWCTFTPRAF